MGLFLSLPIKFITSFTKSFSLYSENVSKFGLASLLIQKNEMFDNHKYFY